MNTPSEWTQSSRTGHGPMRVFNHAMSLLGFALLATAVAAWWVLDLAGPRIPHLVALHDWMILIGPLIPR